MGNGGLIPLRDKMTPEQQAAHLAQIRERELSIVEFVCRDKLRYDDEADAWDQAEIQSAEKGETLVAYQCQKCYGWHVGHPIAGSAPERVIAWNKEPASAADASKERDILGQQIADIMANLTMLNDQRPDNWQARRTASIRALNTKRRRLYFLNAYEAVWFALLDWMERKDDESWGELLDRVQRGRALIASQSKAGEGEE